MFVVEIVNPARSSTINYRPLAMVASRRHFFHKLRVWERGRNPLTAPKRRQHPFPAPERPRRGHGRLPGVTEGNPPDLKPPPPRSRPGVSRSQTPFGNALRETPFRESLQIGLRAVARHGDAKRSFAFLRSQTEFGNEGETEMSNTLRLFLPGLTGPFLQPRPERSGGLGHGAPPPFSPGLKGPFRPPAQSHMYRSSKSISYRRSSSRSSSWKDCFVWCSRWLRM